MLFYTAGYYFIFHAQQWQLKKDAREIIESGKVSSNFKSFHIPLEEYLGAVNDDEIIFEDLIYDIVSSEWHGSTVTILCLPDEKESDLLKELWNFLSRNMPTEESGSDGNDVLLKFIDTFFIAVIQPEYSLSTCIYAQDQCLYSYYLPPVVAHFSPPPESVMNLFSTAI
jgi:hypothetical protein